MSLLSSTNVSCIVISRKSFSHIDYLHTLCLPFEELERKEAEINQFLARTASTPPTKEVDHEDKFVEKVIKMPSSSIPNINPYRPYGVQNQSTINWQSSSAYHNPYSESINKPVTNMGHSSKVTFNDNENYSWKTSSNHMSHRRETETKYSITGRRNEMNEEQLIGNVTDHWKTPKFLNTNETAFVSHFNNGIDYTGLGSSKWESIPHFGTTDPGSSTSQQLNYQPGLNSGKEDIEDFTAIRRQKEALQKLPRLTATPELRQSIKEYKKEFRK